jgi:S-adenosylmethionine:tRNA ribosyltransferase-isomerase
MNPNTLHRPHISIEEYDYFLPEDRIAFQPAPNRSESKLLIWDKAIIAEDHYINIATHIPSNHSLIFNNSKVIAARILFEKQVAENKSIIEIFCLEPTTPYLPAPLAMQANTKVSWICLVGGAKKWKELFLIKQIQIEEVVIEFRAAKKEASNGKFVIEFSWNNSNYTFSELLHHIGKIPLPPYIQREANNTDIERYQTTYAKAEGSVAAPTAGLHFDAPVFTSLNAKEIKTDYLTLHVGAGTFMPVKTEFVEDHIMHAEFIEVSLQTIESLANYKQPIVSVGTTSLRTLESLFWLGVKIKLNPSLKPEEVKLDQWEAYENRNTTLTKVTALQTLIDWMHKYHLQQLITSTQLIITPGYQFKMVNGLVTNFHQPKSTLLLIIAAITGHDWKVIYQHAIQNKYRFLSYGDGCLFWIRPQEV